jgi:hypothetical protein
MDDRHRHGARHDPNGRPTGNLPRLRGCGIESGRSVSVMRASAEAEGMAHVPVGDDIGDRRGDCVDHRKRPRRHRVRLWSVRQWQRNRRPSRLRSDAPRATTRLGCSPGCCALEAALAFVAGTRDRGSGCGCSDRGCVCCKALQLARPPRPHRTRSFGSWKASRYALRTSSSLGMGSTSLTGITALGPRS